VRHPASVTAGRYDVRARESDSVAINYAAVRSPARYEKRKKKEAERTKSAKRGGLLSFEGGRRGR